MASNEGVSSKVLKTSPLIGGDSEVLDDKYNFEQDTDHLKQSLYAENDEDDVKGDQSAPADGLVEKRAKNDFLKVYKEN